MSCDGIVQQLLVEAELCDAEIAVGDFRFRANRSALCSCSAFFRKLFSSEAAASGQQVYTFSQVSPNVMGAILEYAHGHSVVVRKENVLELLAGANRLAVKGVVQACCDFLKEELCLKNCITTWMLADSHSCPGLRTQACLYTMDHFEEVAASSAKFLQLPVQQLAEILQQDELNVKQESAAFKAVLRWIDHAPEERGGHLVTLLSKVRLLLMSVDYLCDTVATEALVMQSLACRAMVNIATQTLLDVYFGADVERPLTRTRLPPAHLVAIGGWANDSPTNRVEVYDVRADRWRRGNNNGEAPRAFHGCVSLDGWIYCIGGFDGASCLNSVQKHHLANNTWQEVGSMHAARRYVSVVTLDGCIYAMGGYDGRQKLNTAERYKPDSDQWTLIAPMHERRSNAAAAALHGRAYILGGFDRFEPLSTAECYDPRSDQWTPIAPMAVGFNGTRAAAYRDQIYVVGGYRGGWYTTRVLVYEPAEDRWRLRSTLETPRGNCGVSVLEDHLYVAGGINHHGAICKVERYDGNTNRWCSIRDMETPRSSLTCCVVNK